MENAHEVFLVVSGVVWFSCCVWCCLVFLVVSGVVFCLLSYFVVTLFISNKNTQRNSVVTDTSGLRMLR